jgi:hypothetical protein
MQLDTNYFSLKPLICLRQNKTDIRKTLTYNFELTVTFLLETLICGEKTSFVYNVEDIIKNNV